MTYFTWHVQLDRLLGELEEVPHLRVVTELLILDKFGHPFLDLGHSLLNEVAFTIADPLLRREQAQETDRAIVVHELLIEFKKLAVPVAVFGNVLLAICVHAGALGVVESRLRHGIICIVQDHNRDLRLALASRQLPLLQFRSSLSHH